MLDRYGYVLTAADVPGAELTTVAYVGPGRPLGFHLHNSSIYICDSLKGLTKYDLESGKLSILANAVSRASQIDPGSPISYANDLDIASDGTVYFTDSTAIPVALNREGFYDTMKTYLLSFLQGGASGRLIKYSPATGEAVVLVPKLSFANGVALAEDESYVLAVETSWCVPRILHLFT